MAPMSCCSRRAHPPTPTPPWPLWRRTRRASRRARSGPPGRTARSRRRRCPRPAAGSRAGDPSGRARPTPRKASAGRGAPDGRCRSGDGAEPATTTARSAAREGPARWQMPRRPVSRTDREESPGVVREQPSGHVRREPLRQPQERLIVVLDEFDVRRTAHEVSRAVGGGVRPEEHAIRADLVEKPFHLARTAPRRLEVQVGQLLRVPACPAPPLERPEIGVVQDEADTRKPLGEPADQVRVRRSWTAVDRDRHPRLGSDAQVGVERRRVRGIAVVGGMQLEAHGAVLEPAPDALDAGPAGSHPNQPGEPGNGSGDPVDVLVVLPGHQGMGHTAGVERGSKALEAQRVPARATRVDVRVDRVEPDPQPVVGLVVVVAAGRPVVAHDAVDDQVVLGVDLGDPADGVDALHRNVPRGGPAVVSEVQHEPVTVPGQRTAVADLGAPGPLGRRCEPLQRTVVRRARPRRACAQRSTIQPLPALSSQLSTSSEGSGLPLRRRWYP